MPLKSLNASDQPESCIYVALFSGLSLSGTDWGEIRQSTLPARISGKWNLAKMDQHPECLRRLSSGVSVEELLSNIAEATLLGLFENKLIEKNKAKFFQFFLSSNCLILIVGQSHLHIVLKKDTELQYPWETWVRAWSTPGLLGNASQECQGSQIAYQLCMSPPCTKTMCVVVV